MTRKSSSIEERARDALQGFLLSLQRRPLECLLRLYFPDGLPKELTQTRILRVEKEVETNLVSRVDLVISGSTRLLFIEVKVDAVEQVGQYAKYKQYFESEGYTVTAGGLINRRRRARTKDNTRFLEALGVKQISWFEILQTFQRHFGVTEEFSFFKETLFRLSPAIGARPIAESSFVRDIKKDSDLLFLRNDILCEFYQDLLRTLTPMEGALWQYGSSPYCLTFGRRSWQQKFQEHWFYHCFICLDKESRTEPQFKLSVMLWNRGATKNTEWFSAHREELAKYFDLLGFDIGRNDPSTWHRRITWQPPYDIGRLKYANAIWSPRVRLNERGLPKTWDALLSQSKSRCFELAAVVERFPSD